MAKDESPYESSMLFSITTMVSTAKHDGNEEIQRCSGLLQEQDTQQEVFGWFFEVLLVAGGEKRHSNIQTSHLSAHLGDRQTKGFSALVNEACRSPVDSTGIDILLLVEDVAIGNEQDVRTW